MSDYCNNLRRGDPVLCVSMNRAGTVSAQPRETSRFVKVRPQGNNTPKSIDIADLRLVVDGKPEDVPPYDGTLPEQVAQVPPAPKGYSSIPNMVADLKAQRQRCLDRIGVMNEEVRGLRALIEKADQAIKVLES